MKCLSVLIAQSGIAAAEAVFESAIEAEREKGKEGNEEQKEGEKAKDKEASKVLPFLLLQFARFLLTVRHHAALCPMGTSPLGSAAVSGSQLLDLVWTVKRSCCS